MFTGIIETIGTVSEVRPGNRSISIGVKPDKTDFQVAVGASVAIDGVCLTVEKCDGILLHFTAVNETLSRSTLERVTAGRRVNMERALPAAGRFDGHMVLGHVDAVGMISRDMLSGTSVFRSINFPDTLAPFMAEKGSVAIDGVSLTIVSVHGNTIGVALIPHTMRETTMRLKRAGDSVNLECDIVARYLHRMVVSGAVQESAVAQADGESLLSRMERLGF